MQNNERNDNIPCSLPTKLPQRLEEPIIIARLHVQTSSQIFDKVLLRRGHHNIRSSHASRIGQGSEPNQATSQSQASKGIQGKKIVPHIRKKKRRENCSSIVESR